MFNAETIIEGLTAGLIGVGVVALVMHSGPTPLCTGFGRADIAMLPPVAGAILVAIRRVPVVVAGLSPRWPPPAKDPVEALRSGVGRRMR